jgi:alpha-tubulin suppressor-like RCC1 family protein
VHLAATPHCFGSNENNVLTERTLDGFLPLNSIFSPPQLAGRIVSSSAHGETESCYLSNGVVVCAGATSPTGSRVTLTGPKKICSGKAFSCALGYNQELQCWGDNSFKQIENSTTASFSTPVATTIGKVLDFACLSEALCVIKPDQKIWCQGNRFGASGLQRALQLKTDNFVKIKAGSNFACAQTSTHKLICFGENNHSQLGSRNPSSDYNEGVEVFSDSGIVRNFVHEFSVGEEHACATSLTGSEEKLYCWGNNSHGQVAQFDEPVSTVVTNIKTHSGTIYDIAAGSQHSCLHINGTIQCFGNKEFIAVDPGLRELQEFNPILPLIYR